MHVFNFACCGNDRDTCLVPSVAVTTATRVRCVMSRMQVNKQIRMQVNKCNKCGAVLNDDNQSQNKREKSCKPCVAKRTLLSQMFAGWPISAFTELSAEQQTLFWESSHACPSKGALHTLVVKDITSHRVDIKLWRNADTFLPLSVYATQGFNTTKIEQNCASRWCDQLEEMTYKLTQRSEIEGEV